MSKTITTLPNGQKAGHVGLGLWGEQGIGSVKQVIYDGDTINVRAMENFGIRFLGIDTAEKKIPLPGNDTFISLNDPRWVTFLTDPFSDGGSLHPSPYSQDLTDYLNAKMGANSATNHKKIADLAEDKLEEFIQADFDEMGQPEEEFGFYLRFAFEIMDRYGRFLCFINRNQPVEDDPSPRPLTYNVRMLLSGMASPYFIWPNINPWRSLGSITAAVIAPNTANATAEGERSLREARQAVKNAR